MVGKATRTTLVVPSCTMGTLRSLPLCLWLGLLAACTVGPSVTVSIGELPPDVRSLRISIVGTGITTRRDVTQSHDRFILHLPRGASGRYDVAVHGLGGSGCLLAAGEGAVEIGDAQDYPLSIRLEPREGGCSVTVRSIGEGTVRAKRLAAPGAVEERLIDWPCSPLCRAGAASELAPGQTLELVAEPAEGRYFAGWSKGCLGTGSCAVTVEAGARELRADFLPLTSSTEHGFRWENPLPDGVTYHAMWGTSSTSIWAAGQAGTLRRFNGSFWIPIELSERKTLRGLFGWARAGGDRAQPEADLVAVGERGTVLACDPERCQPLSSPLGAYELHGVWGTGPRDFWVAGATRAPGTGGVLAHFSNGEWSLRATPTALWALVGIGAHVIAGGDGGRLEHFDGAGWSQSSIVPAEPIRKLIAFAADDLWAITGYSKEETDAQGTVIRTHGSVTRLRGGRWEKLPVRDAYYSALFGLSGDDVWFSTEGALMHYRDGGRIDEYPIDWPHPNALWGSGPDDIWGSGAVGARSRWNGRSWSHATLGEQPPLGRVAGSGPDDVLAVGGDRILERQGDHWFSRLAVRGINMRGLWTDGRVRHVGGDRWLLSWQRDRPDRPVALTISGVSSIWGSSADDVWLVGGAMYHIAGDGALARLAPVTTAGLVGVWGSGPRDLWVVGVGGTVLRGDGQTWTPLRDVPGLGNKSVLVGVTGTSASDVWLASINEGLWHFDGAVWQRLPAPPGMSSILAIATERRGDLWVGGSGTTSLAHVLDGGVEFTEELGSEIRSIYAAGGHVFAVGGGGAILHRSPSR